MRAAGHRLLGLDVGDRRVGVAVADESAATVRPLATFRRGTLEDDAALVARLAAEQHADELVVGLPLDMRGGEGTQAQRTRAWADAIAERTGLRLAWRDERLTTAAAEASQPPIRRDSAGRPTRSAIMGRRVAVDREAAARILQAELDARSDATSMAQAAAGAGTTGSGAGTPEPARTQEPERSTRATGAGMSPRDPAGTTTRDRADRVATRAPADRTGGKGERGV